MKNEFELNIIINSIKKIDLEKITYDELILEIKYFKDLIKSAEES